jgi:hypothetical protein
LESLWKEAVLAYYLKYNPNNFLEGLRNPNEENGFQPEILTLDIPSANQECQDVQSHSYWREQMRDILL